MVFSVRSTTEASIDHLEITITKTLRHNRSKGKVMFEPFFNSSGTVHMELIPEGATVKKQHYKEILLCLRNSIRHRHPELWHRMNWLLLHSNTPAHRSVLVQQELAKQTGHCSATLSILT
jgi:hypothetical protein